MSFRQLVLLPTSGERTKKALSVGLPVRAGLKREPISMVMKMQLYCKREVIIYYQEYCERATKSMYFNYYSASKFLSGFLTPVNISC